MPTVIRTNLAVILSVLRARLVDVTGLPPERVGLLQREEAPFNAHGDGYVYLRVEDGGFDMPDLIGAGRIDTREEILFSVTARSRCALDESNMDWLWLTEESLGNLKLRHAVLEAMVCFQPTDSEGNWLVTEPIKPSRSRRPRKEPGTRDRPNKDWGESVTYWELKYECDLTQTYQ